VAPEERPRSWTDEGREAGFDDAWHEEWWRRMEEGGGNIIASWRMRMVEVSRDRVVMELPYGPAVRQGTGVFAAGALMQLADVAATSACFEYMNTEWPPEQVGFPVSIQISTNLIRNTDHGKVVSETRLIHAGRSLMVAESVVRDEDGRLLATVTSTHMVPRAAPPQ
jgi:uncharacterized protein (TIGR00369 family)